MALASSGRGGACLMCSLRGDEAGGGVLSQDFLRATKLPKSLRVPGRIPKPPKRPSVASLAQEQSSLRETNRSTGVGQQLPDPGPRRSAITCSGCSLSTYGPSARPDLSPGLPLTQHVPKALSQLVKPPPPARQAPAVPSPAVDLEQKLAVQAKTPRPKKAPCPWLRQSQALVSLMGQMAQSSDPLLDQPSATSLRGAVGH